MYDYTYDSNKYSDLRKNFLFMLDFVDPDDLLEFWRDLNNEVAPKIIEAEKRRTRVNLVFNDYKKAETSLNSWAYRSGEL